MNDRDNSFDQAMRRLHAEALAQVTPGTRARLRSARHVAATQAPGPARRGFGWVLASGFAAVFALAIGLQFQQQPRPDAAAPAANGRTAATQAPAAYEYDYAVAALDENPDLYLWLASNDDALPPASE